MDRTDTERTREALNKMWDTVDSALEHIGRANWPGREEEAREWCREAYENLCAAMDAEGGKDAENV